MNKTFIIIKREYLSRVKKKSFIIMSLLTPILIAGIYAFMIWMMMKDDTENRNIAVINNSTLEQPIENTEFTNYTYLEGVNFEQGKELIKQEKFYALVLIPKNLLKNQLADIYSTKQVTIEVKNNVSNQLQNFIEQQKRDKIISQSNIPDLEKKLNATKTPIKIKTIKFGEDGEIRQGSTEIAMAIGFISSFIIYMFIFMYGVQVMRGVIEEKSNRVIEVIISSVKPFELMMGKIIGVAMVGLTQFILWIGLSGAIILIGSAIFMPSNMQEAGQISSDLASMNSDQMSIVNDIINTFDASYIASILGAFLFYFLGGYLLYSALFAAVGSAVDNETETQQFMMPITIPLVMALYIGFAVAKNPESSLAFWSSIIPFTSPIVMLVRIPFGVPIWELLLSMSLLILTFLFITWIAAKIYRTGILMYGKKITYKEIWKWIRHSS